MGLLKSAAKVAVASSVHGRIQRRQQQRWAAQDAATAGYAPAPAAAAAIPEPHPIEADVDQQLARLAQLGQLRDTGVLTDVEFEAKKAQILAL